MKSMNEIKEDNSATKNIAKTRLTFNNYDNTTIKGSGIGSFDNATENINSDY